MVRIRVIGIKKIQPIVVLVFSECHPRSYMAKFSAACSKTRKPFLFRTALIIGIKNYLHNGKAM